MILNDFGNSSWQWTSDKAAKTNNQSQFFLLLVVCYAKLRTTDVSNHSTQFGRECLSTYKHSTGQTMNQATTPFQ